MKGQVLSLSDFNAPFLLPKGRQFVNLEYLNKMFVSIWNVCHTHGHEVLQLSAEGNTSAVNN
jgi:hypothetical protein